MLHTQSRCDVDRRGRDDVLGATQQRRIGIQRRLERRWIRRRRRRRVLAVRILQPSGVFPPYSWLPTDEVLAALLCLSAIYLWRFAYDGWIPHDDGMLGQIAERVIAGEMPHRDFDDPYTGLLGYLHGLGFLTFGISLRSIRLVLFLFTLAWLPAMYVLARHFVPPLGAALVTALAMTWTLPNYFAAVPSYYNLFLATFGMVALARHVDTDRRYWLGIAGAFGGLAFLIKSAGGFYFVAAALLFLVCRERETVSHGTDHLPASSAPSRLRDRVIDAAAARQAPWRGPHRASSC